MNKVKCVYISNRYNNSSKEISVDKIYNIVPKVFPDRNLLTLIDDYNNEYYFYMETLDIIFEDATQEYREQQINKVLYEFTRSIKNIRTPEK